MDRIYDVPSLMKTLDSLLCDSSTLHSLYGAKLLQEDLKKDAVKLMPMISYFVERYVHGKNAKAPSCNDGNNANKKSFAKPTPMWSGKIETVCDIEENMWSPWLGIKGKVDFTVKVTAFKVI